MKTVQDIKAAVLAQPIELPGVLAYCLRLILAKSEKINFKLYFYGEYINLHTQKCVTGKLPTEQLELKVGLEIDSKDVEAIKNYINDFVHCEIREGNLCFYTCDCTSKCAHDSYLINVFPPEQFSEDLAMEVEALKTVDDLPEVGHRSVLNRNETIENILKIFDESNLAQVISIASNNSQQQSMEQESSIIPDPKKLDNEVLDDGQHKSGDSIAKQINEQPEVPNGADQLPEIPNEEEQQSEIQNKEEQESETTDEAEQQVEFSNEKGAAEKKYNKKRVKKREKAPPPTPTFWQTMWQGASDVLSWCVNITLSTVKWSYKKTRDLMRGQKPAPPPRRTNPEIIKEIQIAQGRYVAPPPPLITEKKSIPSEPPLIATVESPPSEAALIAKEELWKSLKLIFDYFATLESINAIFHRTAEELPLQTRPLHTIFACMVGYLFWGKLTDFKTIVGISTGFTFLDNTLAQAHYHDETPQNRSRKKNDAKNLKQNDNKIITTSPASFFYKTLENHLTSPAMRKSKEPLSYRHKPYTFESLTHSTYFTRAALSYVIYLACFGLPSGPSLAWDLVSVLVLSGINSIADNNVAAELLKIEEQKNYVRPKNH